MEFGPAVGRKKGGYAAKLLARPKAGGPESAPDPMHLSSDGSWWSFKAGA